MALNFKNKVKATSSTGKRSQVELWERFIREGGVEPCLPYGRAWERGCSQRLMPLLASPGAIHSDRSGRPEAS